MSIKGKANINDLISSLDSQISYMDDYAANIKKAMELGVNEGLIAKLSDGSKESAKILAGIVADGGKNVDELNEKFAEVENGKQEFAGIVADMKTDFGTKMDAIQARLDLLVNEMDKADEAGKAAKETGDSYAAGLRSRIDAVYNAAKALAQAANKGWNDYYEKHSPAKVAIKAAAETADSYAMGFEQRFKKIEETTRKFARAANEGYTKTMQEIEWYSRPLEDAMRSMAYKLSDSVSWSASAKVTTKEIIRDSGFQPQFNGPIYINNDMDIKTLAEKLGYYYRQTRAAQGA